MPVHSSFQYAQPTYATPKSYFDTWESRIGYKLILGGIRHFGFYDPGTLWSFPITRALKRMEDRLHESLSLQAGALVLDAGCGAGQVALHLASKGLRMRAIDITDNHVRWAQQAIMKTPGMQDMVTATLAEFYRVLKPGGRIVLHEYDHIDASKPPDDCPPDLVQAVIRINTRSGMVANELFARGVLQQMMQDQGFEDIEAADLTENIRPMMRLFFMLGYIPYLIICFLGLQAWFVNTEVGVQGYRALRRGYWRYMVFTARTPNNH
ncbi:MAG: hypothetical protein Q9166_006021 [cf. Caloplaca sp. 2 TL-2023]